MPWHSMIFCIDMTFDIWHLSLDIWYSTNDTWHLTFTWIKAKAVWISFIATQSFEHMRLSSGIKQEWGKICPVELSPRKWKFLVIHNFFGGECEPWLVSTAWEYLLSPVQRGQLLLEQDEPALQEAQPALLGGRVVPTGSGQDWPTQLVGDGLVLELPYVGA